MKFFVDTYALIEMANGNLQYASYVNEELYTSLFNLYEFYYNILRDYGQKMAQDFFYEYLDRCLPITEENIFLASKFKLKYAKKNVSYVDALGYVMAVTEGMKFLTGDKAFQYIENVEWVK